VTALLTSMAVNTDDCVDCVSDADPVKGTEVNADSQVADQTRTTEITVAYKGIVKHERLCNRI
jgi:hypothetical protein